MCDDRRVIFSPDKGEHHPSNHPFVHQEGDCARRKGENGCFVLVSAASCSDGRAREVPYLNHPCLPPFSLPLYLPDDDNRTGYSPCTTLLAAAPAITTMVSGLAFSIPSPQCSQCTFRSVSVCRAEVRDGSDSCPSEASRWGRGMTKRRVWLGVENRTDQQQGRERGSDWPSPAAS